jgi:predicted PhzF superfamily epimerase YddE/YHI9
VPTLPIYQVDAFTDRPFAGNPAAVCPLEAPIPEALMQDIAAENNLSETAFFHPQGDAFSLRWFTPTTEVELCGHATLASAFVLMTALEPARSEVTFRTRSGLLPVRRRDDEFVLDFPAYPAAPRRRRDGGARRGGVARPTARGRARALAVRRAGQRRRRARVRARLRRALAAAHQHRHHRGGRGRSAARRLRGALFRADLRDQRGSGDGLGVLHAAPYWGARLGKQALRARQVSRRGGEVACALAGERVHIGGKARLVITGTLTY